MEKIAQNKWGFRQNSVVFLWYIGYLEKPSLKKGKMNRTPPADCGLPGEKRYKKMAAHKAIAFCERAAERSVSIGGKDPRIVRLSIWQSEIYRLHASSSITFNVGISNISSSIFAGCPFITSVNFIGSKTQWLEITKDLNWNYNVICEDGAIIYS